MSGVVMATLPTAICLSSGLGRKRLFAITAALVPLLARERSSANPGLRLHQSLLSANKVEFFKFCTIFNCEGVILLSGTINVLFSYIRKLLSVKGVPLFKIL